MFVSFSQFSTTFIARPWQPQARITKKKLRLLPRKKIAKLPFPEDHAQRPVNDCLIGSLCSLARFTLEIIINSSTFSVFFVARCEGKTEIYLGEQVC